MTVNKILKNSSLYTFCALLQKGTGFLLLPIYTTYLKPEDYGIMNLITSITGFLSILFLVSLHAAAARFHFKYVTSKGQAIVWGTILLMVLFNSAFWGLICIIFHDALLVPLAEGIPFYPLLLLAILGTMLSPLYLFYQQWLQCTQDGLRYTLNLMCNFLLQVFLNLLMLMVFHQGVLGIIISSFIVSMIFFIYSMISFLPHITLCINKEISVAAFKYSLPLIPHSVSGYLSVMLDRILLNKLIGIQQVGLYGVANQFGNILNLFTSSINQAFTPWLYQKLEKENESSNYKSIYEVSDELLQDAISNYDFVCTSDINRIRGCNFYVVAVPTPVDANNRPDLTPLWRASETVGKVISKGDIVVYESTVYPGVTEEECLPVVERVSGLKFNKDFFAGYSPERINPGDKEHTVEKIKKVTSGSTPEIADIVDNVYNSVLVNGTHKAPSIKVAEASKIIENSQRDVNIAFMNELAKIFNAMGIDTNDVIEAASSKWNFIKLKPGLVGGHCISVDPYYLIQKAQVYGVLPRVMFSARRLNDGMGDYVGNQVIKLMNKKGVLVKDSNVLILGFTFKENCPDVRNTKIVDIYHTLEEYTKNITVYDPWANADKVEHEYGVQLTSSSLESLKGKFNAVILAVAHKEFVSLDIRSFLKNENGVVYDVKGILDREMIDGRL